MKEVYDGDTFSLTTGQRVKLADLNAPALENCYGQEAKKKLSQLILDKGVSISPQGIDNFRRTIKPYPIVKTTKRRF